MVKIPKHFNIGERVFAKVRGYPPWPAKIESITEPNTKNAKYHVIFYGTGEIGACKIEDIFTYADNKAKYSKPGRRKYFLEGIQELEDDLRNFPNDRPETSVPKDYEPGDSILDTTADDSSEKEESLMETSMAPLGDSDAETGNLVIDEGEKKKSMKRKLHTTLSTPESAEIKKKRGRKSMPGVSTDVGKPAESAHDSFDEDAEKKVVSRSGRKIKPKRFHDHSDAEIPIDPARNDSSFRAKIKSKSEEQLESPETPSAPPKKRISSEKDDKKHLAKDEISIKNQNRTKILRIEVQLLNWEHDIKASLLLDEAKTDKCLEAMDKMMALNVTPLMLKKHPFVVETIKRLRVYIGNLSQWKLSQEEIHTFNQNALLIQKKGEQIYDKFRKLFDIPANESFWNVFMKEVEHFKAITKDKTEAEIFGVIVDPTIGAKEKTTTTDEKNSSDSLNSTKMETSTEESPSKYSGSDSEVK